MTSVTKIAALSVAWFGVASGVLLAEASQEKPVSAKQDSHSNSEQSQSENMAPQSVAPVVESDGEKRPDFSAKLLKKLDKATALNPKETAFLDLAGKRVLLKTRVICNDCLLEMLVCPAKTREHEAVLSFDGKAYVLHTALLAMGLKPGRSVVFSPEFKKPNGPQLTMTVHWQDQDGKLHSEDARKWLRTSVAHYYSKNFATPPKGIEFPFLELRYDKYNKELLWFGQMTKKDKKTLLAKNDEKNFQETIEEFYQSSQPKPMNAEFVFTGSYMTQRIPDGPEFYAAEDGHLICVANLASATIDVREASSASDGSQSYESNVDVVPDRHTPVILEISPTKTPEE